MKRITMLAVLVAIALLTGLSGCQFLLEQKPGTGGVTFSLDLSAKTIQPPDASITIAKYAVSGTGPSGAVLSETLYSGSSFTISNLVAGAWTITISGRNVAGTEIGKGIVNLTIVSGNTVTANVTLAPLTGEGVTGSFTFSASWTSPLVVTGISGTITASGGEAEPFTAPISGSTASYSVPTLAAGSYLLSLTATESGGEKFKAIYALRVYKGLTSPLTIAFTMADFLGTTLPTYTVNYIGDGNTGGSVPVDENEYLEGASVTVLGNTGSLEKTDYTFDGWNTELGGTGTSYSVGSTFTMGAGDAELYAKWKYSKKCVVKGVLSGDDLTWTKARGPYQIDGNILVEPGTTLSIEPGVEVRFNGNYYIRIDGCIKAIGTSDAYILFTSLPSGPPDGPPAGPPGGYYTGGIILNRTAVPLQMNEYTYVSGSIFDYCKFVRTSGISSDGAALIRNCVFDSTNSNSISCGGNEQGKLVISCDINANFYLVYSRIVNSRVHDCNYIGFYGSSVNNCTFEKISTISQYSGSDFQRCIFDAITSSLTASYGFSVSNSIISNINNKYYITAPSTGYSGEMNASGNYWGAENTIELINIGSNKNVSFLYDYYDDFNLWRVNYSNWVSEPWEGVGYCGDAFVSFNFSATRMSGTSYADLALGVQTSRPLSRIRWGQTATELLAAAWVPYTASISVPFDPAKKDSSNNIKILCQAEDTEGNRSGAFTSSFIYTP